MTNALVEDRITELNVKLDYIVEEIQHLKRMRHSAEDLAADLALVGKDAMGEATAALSAIDLHPQDTIQLFKTVLVDARLLTTALQQLESASDFVQDAQPILRDLYQQAVIHLQQLEEKGYFNTARAGIRITDALIQAHSAEDLKQVEASIPQLIGLLRELTRPEVLEALESIIHGFGRVQATMNVNKSILQIVHELNSADARRGIAILVEFLKILGARSTTVVPATSPAATTQEQ